MMSFSLRQNKPSMVLCLLLALFSAHLLVAASGRQIEKATFYPRLVRVTQGAGQGRLLLSTNRQIFESTDEGRSFHFLDEVPIREGTRYRCCETLYEVPQDIGSLHAGTLLFACSCERDHVPAIEIYVSTDQGHSWTYHSTPVDGAGEKGHGGLWEPEFSIAHTGPHDAGQSAGHNSDLVMFWSDETYLCCSQKLSKVRTSDGLTWRDRSDVVASTTEADRPGMIVVRQMPTNQYFMTYEVCGDPLTGHHCQVFYRTSRDGWDYGPPSYSGARVQTADGKYFEHAPANLWSPAPGQPNGVIVVAGQVLKNPDGSVAPENGKVLFVNPLLDGSGPWTMIPAPVQVPNSYDNWCPNYSSALLPTSNGAALIEVTSDYAALKQCATYFAVSPWSVPPPDVTKP